MAKQKVLVERFFLDGIDSIQKRNLKRKSRLRRGEREADPPPEIFPKTGISPYGI